MKTYKVGSTTKNGMPVPRITLGGEALEDTGFVPGSGYRVLRHENGLLITPAGPDYTFKDNRIPEPNYDSWYVKLRLEPTASGAEPWAIDSPEEAFRVARTIGASDRERILALLLGSRNQLLGIDECAVGGLNLANVKPREVYKAAVHANAAAIVMAHNHPSGDPSPSADDIRLTKRLSAAGETLGISLLDHLVVGYDSYKSLREEDLM